MTRKMKDSGIQWIGQIPEHWSRTFIINILREPICDGPHETPKLVDCGVPFVSVDSLNESENINLDIVRKYISEEDYMIYSKKTKIEKEDILFSKSATIGKTAIVKNEKFMVWSPIAVLKCNRSIMNNKYLYYILSSDKLIEYVRLLGGYNTQINVGMRTLEKAYIPLPSKAEQQVIANYLDNKCNKIEKTIEKEKVIVKKLQEYKQSVITEAVTKGLNSDVKMKDSGVKWIGEIPEAWTMGIIKYGTVKIGSGKTPKGGSEVYNSEGILFIRSQNVYNEGLVLENSTYISEEIDSDMAGTRVYYNDILLNITGGSIGRCCLYDIENCHANVNQHVCIIRTKPDIILPKYMKYFWNSDVGKNSINIYQTGANREGMNFEQIGNTRIPYMHLQEQQEIIDYLDKKCSAIDKLITNKEKVIEKLTEYKKSLIYECVTGKREIK